MTAQEDGNEGVGARDNAEALFFLLRILMFLFYQHLSTVTKGGAGRRWDSRAGARDCTDAQTRLEPLVGFFLLS
jgi:hypothetical protein